jgi:LmbE family N-acetylglucosaminyl deacetylase
VSVLAVSPHLDDAVFSCGALLGDLRDVTLLTVFTASVPDPQGFALACQTDKGIAPEVDYMALRRAEDRAAAEALGIARVVHLGLPEAPHRGYGSAEELFSGVREDDRAAGAVAEALRPHVQGAERILAPLGLGAHVDHLVVLDALLGLVGDARVECWRDTPYVLREPARAGGDAVPVGAEALDRKLDACAAYASQLGFQFGGEERMRAAIAAYAEAEGHRHGLDGPAEVLERLAG